ncbi:MAG: DNA-binding transcriptional MerR regulator [Cognaticolwellia sp.]
MPTSELVPIGVLSHLSGVPADTIRTWERRYRLLVPARDARGRRVYSGAQLARLRLIASLNEHGERIADLAKLSDDELESRALLHKENTEQLLPQVIRVAVLHPTLARSLPGPIAGLSTQLQIIPLTEGGPLPSGLGPVDVVLAALESLGPDPISLLRRIRLALQPTSLVVTYSYMPRPLREKLQTQPLRLLKGYTTPERMRELVVQGLLADRLRKGTRSSPQSRSPMRFTAAQLTRLQNTVTRLECECPNHVAALVGALLAFEVYSQNCSSVSPADADLHSKLSVGTSQARAVMEELLMTLVKAEGIEL